MLPISLTLHYVSLTTGKFTYLNLSCSSGQSSAIFPDRMYNCDLLNKFKNADISPLFGLFREISNLWTTTAALSKLPSIKELRFQNCLCCKHTGACPALSSENANGDATSVSGADVTNQASAVDDSIKDSENHHRYKNLSDTCTVELSSDLQRMNLFGLSSDAIPNLSGCVEIPNKVTA